MKPAGRVIMCETIHPFSKPSRGSCPSLLHASSEIALNSKGRSPRPTPASKIVTLHVGFGHHTIKKAHNHMQYCITLGLHSLCTVHRVSSVCVEDQQKWKKENFDQVILTSCCWYRNDIYPRLVSPSWSSWKNITPISTDSKDIRYIIDPFGIFSNLLVERFSHKRRTRSYSHHEYPSQERGNFYPLYCHSNFCSSRSRHKCAS
jgi:hypothetical protein